MANYDARLLKEQNSGGYQLSLSTDLLVPALAIVAIAWLGYTYFKSRRQETPRQLPNYWREKDYEI